MGSSSASGWRHFVLERARTAKVATVRDDGRPHVVPVWVALDADAVVFTTGADTVKGRGIARDRRVSICFDDEEPPFTFAMVEGLAEISEEPGELLEWATRIAARYMGEDRAEAYGRRNGVPGELLVRVRPTSVVFMSGIAD